MVYQTPEPRDTWAAVLDMARGFMALRLVAPAEVVNEVERRALTALKAVRDFERVRQPEREARLVEALELIRDGITPMSSGWGTVDVLREIARAALDGERTGD